MANWRCPHCGTPQPEADRCWVCSRSSTTCSSCTHYRRPVAGTSGICGADPKLAIVRADEIRACWEDRQLLVPAGDASRSELFEVAPRRG
ncbi:MAG: hypothetical protein ACHQ02_01830 [Candidatus Limnocylindrales bacterium]|jgi:hypothetical protein